MSGDKDDSIRQAGSPLKIGQPEWGPSWYMAKASYPEMEVKVSPKI